MFKSLKTRRFAQIAFVLFIALVSIADTGCEGEFDEWDAGYYGKSTSVRFRQ